MRKIYFSALVKSLLTIADNSYEHENENEYYNIPENKERLYDLILRNVTILKNSNSYKVDIGIKREELFDETLKKIYYKGTIAGIGDLSIFHGYTEQNLEGYYLELPQKFDVSKTSVEEFLRNRIAFIKGEQKDLSWTEKPINFFNLFEPALELKIDGLANFFLTKDNQLKYAVINGFLIDLSRPLKFTGNGLVLP